MVEEQPGRSAAAMPALSVGALLAEARAGMGRDLQDIARETRVPLRHLMAIEADDHDALPALPYALGFVKAFARAVNLDAEAIGARFRAETRLVPHVPTPTAMEPLDEARLPSRGLAFGAMAALVIVLGGLGLYGAGVFDPAPKVAAVAADTGVAGADLPAADQPVAAAAASETPAAAAGPAAAIPANGEVVLTAREDVWVKIYSRATGRKAFQGLMVAGSIYKVPTDAGPLTLRAGRAGVIEVRVGGVLLPPLGGSVDTIDGVVLTAPALAERFAPAVAQLPAVQPTASPPAPSSVQP